MDAFAGLKEEDQFRDEDKESKCYICGMSKADVILFKYEDVKEFINFLKTHSKT